MFIKSIVLDGFKSYGHRTEISGFDDQFNAITGLNGSGKSNILDAICFVLGITNLSHVRVSNLQDLIFKSGQCGINKASVSITFDNRNPEQCPPGFENVPEITITRQIKMGGKTKYTINGSTVQNKKVQDLFCSIQLNVNNPHFLIMQGKITKVLNMKPLEILGMIQEAAGTKMYEAKRENALKIIEKKEHKLVELKALMSETIEPKLAKVKAERAKFVNYKSIEKELDYLMHIYQAYEYLLTQNKYEEAKKAMDNVQNKIIEAETEINNNKNEIQQLDNLVKELTELTRKEDTQNLTKLESELKILENSQASLNAKIKSLNNEINNQMKKKSQLEKTLADDEKSLTKKEADLLKLEPLFNKLKEAEEKDSQAFYASQKRYEALSAGMDVNEEGEVEGLHEQLFKAREEATKSNTEIKQAEMRLKYLQQKLKEKHRVSKSNEMLNEQKKHDQINENVKNLENSLNKLNYDENKMNDLLQKKRQIVHEIKSLNEKIANFEAYRPYTQFRYRNPGPDFDKKSVLGVVCRLFQVKSEEAMMAIETAAGGRLYNVVVDKDRTGQRLLEKGDLQHRTTFIPLNKIKANKMNNRVVKLAQDLCGKDNVQPAIDHLKYDNNLQIVMEYVFGNVFICSDLNVAKQIAFHDNIRIKCVTLDGDVIDPAGVLSGGAPQKGDSVLKQLEDIKNAEKLLKSKEQELAQIEAEINQLAVKQNKYDSLKRDLEMKKHDLNLIKQKLQQSSHYRNAEEIKQMQNEIDSLKEKIQNQMDNEIKWKEKVLDLESKLKNSKGSRQEQLKQAEKEMCELKKKTEQSRENWKQKEQDFYTFQLEIEEMKKSVEDVKEKITNCDEEVAKLKEKQDEIGSKLEELNENMKKIQTEYDKEKSVLMSKNVEIQEKVHRKEELQKQITDYEVKIKQNNHKLKKLKEDCDCLKTKEVDYKKRVKENYLNEAQKYTGEAGKQLEKKIRVLQENKVALGRTIDSNAQAHFEQQEKDFNDVKKKLQIVESDKIKLLDCIKDLDKTKDEILSRAYEQISKDFGSIFSTLLPGANAKLVPPTGQTIFKGLEVKVSLGGVWKESLTELSGGQRSLAALSLILAMLMFKPAPLYILDEVDAALDLSHTQNIGSMLRTYFKKSQFIIVSLKDGMFSNANVLFRTQFIDGVSAITRTVNRN